MHITQNKHIPVMPKEVIESLNIKPNGIYVDGTVGYGGHSALIAELLNKKGKLFGFDWDVNAVSEASKFLSVRFPKTETHIVHCNYADAPGYLHSHSIEYIDGVLLDLGFSSVQIDMQGRGFGFYDEQSFDMRFDTSSDNETAEEVINRYTEKELADIFFFYGDERRSRSIAKYIVEHRKKNSIISSAEFARVVCGALRVRIGKDGRPTSYHKTHPATKTFQALRIFVNKEYENIKTAISRFTNMLASDGRLVIITFHSGEDRIVKHIFKDILANTSGKYELVYKKALRCTRDEARINPRARSAIVRAIRKI